MLSSNVVSFWLILMFKLNCSRRPTAHKNYLIKCTFLKMMKNQNHYHTIWIISLLIFFHIRHEHLVLISFYSWSNHLNLWFVRGGLKIKQLVFHWKWFHVSLSSSNESSVGGISVIAIFNLTCAKLLVIKSRVFFN